MRSMKFCAVLLAGVFAFGFQSPADAASQLTTAFLTNLQANVSFLDRSSQMAVGLAESDKVRAFASSEVGEQSKLASALNNLVPVIASTGTVVTGRSVAVDGQVAQDAQRGPDQQAANGRAPLAQDDLVKLATLSGRAFDNLYWQQQLDALSQIEADYRAYIANGDDPVLVDMAKTELPKIVSRLDLLSKI